MKFISCSFIFIIISIVAFGQKGVCLSGRVLSDFDGSPLAAKKVYVVFDPSAAPYIDNVNQEIITQPDGSFFVEAQDIPWTVIPLDVLVYTFDCDFQRHGYQITFMQNNLAANGLEISICNLSPFFPSSTIGNNISSASCPAFQHISVHPDLYRPYLTETFRWNINGVPSGTGNEVSAYFSQPNNTIQLTAVFTDSLSGYVFDSVMIQKQVVLPDSIFHILGGNVLFDNAPTSCGKAVLLGKSDWQYFVADTCFYDQYGYFYFPSTPTCSYTVRIIETDAPLMPSFLPTYFGSSLHWGTADYFAFDNDVFNKNIPLLIQQQANGPGEINGTIVAEAPEEYDVILYSAGMQPFSYAHCEPSRHFHFHDLPLGSYILYSEKFGIPSIIGYTTLDAGSPSQSVVLDNTTQLGESDLPSLSVHPNPADQVLYLSVTDDLDVSVYSSEGTLVLRTRTNGGAIDVHTLSGGVYFLNIEFEGQPVQIPFLISR